jgi:DNA-binding CsgD family transcriptional regulator/tetratricopeptide (TPR) repeat protein
VAQRVSSSRFVGRDAELGELERALSGEDQSSPPALFLISGESGVGKTRLLAELIKRAEDRAAPVVGGACIELGEGELPYAPLVAALRPLPRTYGDALDELSESSRAQLARLNPEIGSPSIEPESERGEAQRRLFEAFLELISGLGEERPALFWIEDIHWADSSTRSFLRFLAASLSEERVVVVASYRSDELHRRHPLRPLLAELERPGRAGRIELTRFDRDELFDQLADILGTEPDRAAVERLYGRSGGNPLFTEELLAAGVDGRGSLPPSLRDTLLLRTERLSAPCQRLLRVLAVAGHADEELLAATDAELEPAEVSMALREAVDAQIVVLEGERFGFRHALLREVLYDDLLPGERAELHLAWAATMEGVEADVESAAWSAAAVAHHYHEAGDQPRALRAALEASTAVRRLHAYGEAAALLDRALALWPRVDNPEELSGLDHGGLLTRAARVHYLAGDDGVAEALYQRAVATVGESDPERLASVLAALATSQWALGRTEPSRESQRRGLDLLAGDAESPARARLLAQRVRFLLLQGRYNEVCEAAPEAIDATARLGLDSERAGVLNRYGCALFSLGREQEARARMSESIEIAERTGFSDDLATAYLNYADALHLAGLDSEARAVAEEGVARVQDRIALSTGGSTRSMRFIRLNLAEIHFDGGDWDRAEAALLEAEPGLQGVGRAHARLRFAELALAHGRDEEAGEALEQAEELLTDALEPQYIATLAVLQAELETRRGELECARATIERGLDRIQFCSEDAGRLALTAAAGVAVEAEIAERARDLGDVDAERAASSQAGRLCDLAAAAAEDAGGPVEGARLELARAELARAEGTDLPALWERAAGSWQTLGRPYPEAIARWRQAQASLGRGDRVGATAALTDAGRIADRLGASWLQREAKGLATRARLDVSDGQDPAAKPAAAAEAPFGLTPRELQVLELVGNGATNREIGEELFMAEKTASVHVSRILSKLDVRGRTEAAAVAHRHGIVSNGS